MGLSDSGAEKADILPVRKAERTEGLMDLRCLYNILHLSFGMGTGMWITIMTAR